MPSSRSLPRLALSLGFAALMGVASAEAQQVSVAAVNVEATAQGDLVQATFKVEVTNPGDTAAADVVVVFSDGIQMALGTIEAGSSAVSQPETRTIDRSALPTQNVPVPVTLKYTSGGESVEAAAVLIVRVQ